MGFLAFLQSIKAIGDIAQFIKNSFGNKVNAFIFIVTSFALSCSAYYIGTFIKGIAENQGNQHYNDTVRDNEIYRKVSETLRICGDKSSIMIGAVNLNQRIGVIKDFYSCSGNKNCIVNTKEKNNEYRKSYVVDDVTYAYLQEIGKSASIQNIDLTTGDILTPNRQRLKLAELLTLDNLIRASEWYQNGELRILKLAAIVDLYKLVIFTISFTGSHECLAADELLFSIKEIINQSRNKNALFFTF